MFRPLFALTCALLMSASFLQAADKLILTEADQTFIKSAYEYQMMEITCGEMAAKRTLTEAEKAFANRMVTDHTQAKKELQQIAKEKGVTLPSTLNDDQQEKMQNAEKVKDAEFNKSYLAMSISCHKSLIGLYEEQKEDGKDPELKAYAAKQLIINKKHLETAKQLEENY